MPGKRGRASKIMLNEFGCTPQQALFAELYVSKEFYGNGVESYVEAYQPDKANPTWYNIAKTQASKLLTNTNVCSYINSLLDHEGLNDQFVDKQLLHLITQHNDGRTKVAAIREYNKLKKRIDDRLAGGVTVNVSLSDLFDGSNSTDTKTNT